MSLYYPIPQPTIANNILVRRERRLPLPGEVVVRAGQRVEPADVVAQSTLTSEPQRVDIAGDLDMSPTATSRRLLVSVGAHIEQGGTIGTAGGGGLAGFAVAGGGHFYQIRCGHGAWARSACPPSR